MFRAKTRRVLGEVWIFKDLVFEACGFDFVGCFGARSLSLRGFRFMG